jgi:5'-nucleotidase / UDP-sugar diphosphatase
MRLRRALAAISCVATLCAGFNLVRGQGPPDCQPGEVCVTLLHLNDTYEIMPLNRGRLGGLARVATLRKELKRKNHHTYVVHAGDFLSPSALGTAKVDGKRLAGKQMVAVLKSTGIDCLILGNHEFDLSKLEFDERVKEMTEDTWQPLFSTNVTDPGGQPFPKTPRYRVLEIKNAHDPEPLLRIGIVGLTMKTTKEKDNYAQFETPIDSALRVAKEWQETGLKIDSMLALTHEPLSEDEALAKGVPQIDLILGGHEHDNTHRYIRPPLGQPPRSLPPIFRADANVRTVYIHHLIYDLGRRRLQRIESQLKTIDDTIAEDPATAARVKTWVDVAYRAFRADGFEPDEQLTVLSRALDGRETEVRKGPTNLTDLIGDAMIGAISGGEPHKRLAVFNSGAVRIDDFLLAGPITVYDVLRVLPFPGDVWEVNMRGELLHRILDEKERRRGTGGFLQARHVTSQGDGDERTWLIHGQKLDPAETYRVAINDFVLAGREAGFEFLTLPTEEARGVRIGDWRRIVSNHLRTNTKAGPVTEAPLELKSTAPEKPPQPQDLPAAPGRTVGDEPWLRVAYVPICLLVALGLPAIIVAYILLRSRLRGQVAAAKLLELGLERDYLKALHPAEWTSVRQLDDTRIQAEFTRVFDQRLENERRLKHYALPLLLTVMTTGAFALILWNVFSESHRFPRFLNTGVTCLAIAGALVYVYSLFVSGYASLSLNPPVVFQNLERLWLAVLIGVSVAPLFAENLQPAAAFLGGLLPVPAFRLLKKKLYDEKADFGDEARHSELSEIVHFDDHVLTQLNFVGIRTVLQLAHENPIRIFIESDLQFDVCLELVDAANLYLIVPDAKTRTELRRHGVRTALNLSTQLYERFDGPGESYRHLQADERLPDRLKEPLSQIARAMGLSGIGELRNLIQMLNDEPQIEFIHDLYITISRRGGAAPAR